MEDAKKEEGESKNEEALTANCDSAADLQERFA